MYAINAEVLSEDFTGVAKAEHLDEPLLFEWLTRHKALRVGEALAALRIEVRGCVTDVLAYSRPHGTREVQTLRQTLVQASTDEVLSLFKHMSIALSAEGDGFFGERFRLT